MEKSKKIEIESQIGVIVGVTAITYYLYYQLQIHTIVYQSPCTYLDEFWLNGRSFWLSPLGEFTTIVIALLALTIIDFWCVTSLQQHIKPWYLICTLIVLGCIGYWGYSIFKFHEFFAVERGLVSRIEYLSPEFLEYFVVDESELLRPVNCKVGF